jgi:hypothetical protein
MSTFDQRGQWVNYQYNANGDINFSAVSNKVDALTQLVRLEEEVRRAAISGALEPELAIDVEANIKKAITTAQKPEPDKPKVIALLETAKDVIADVAAVAGLVSGLTKAIEVIRNFL